MGHTDCDECKMKKVKRNSKTFRSHFSNDASKAANDTFISLNMPSLQKFVADKKMNKREREALEGDLLAATNPRYLASIRVAREDYRRSRVLSHQEIFGKLK